MPKSETETQTEYSLRLIREEAWQQGHDATCTGFNAVYCSHENPYSD